ncbi:MAG: hypothetical protein LQ342_002432 [Letrouitia transgressa]|nr:MAG: hypothetical protein LQ342_002432 [Letrouitia transgressa]
MAHIGPEGIIPNDRSQPVPNKYDFRSHVDDKPDKEKFENLYSVDDEIYIQMGRGFDGPHKVHKVLENGEYQIWKTGATAPEKLPWNEKYLSKTPRR